MKKSLSTFIKTAEIVHAGAHIGKESVGDGHRGHGFHHDDCSRDDHRIVAAVDFHVKFRSVVGNGALRLADGRGGLNVGAKNDLASVTDAAQDAACMIGGLDDLTVFILKSIVVCGTV